MNKKYSWGVLVAVAGILVFGMLAGVTLAQISSSSALHANTFSISTLKISVVDIFSQPEEGSGTAQKVVRIQNESEQDAGDSTMAAYVRAAVVPTFRYEKDGVTYAQAGTVEYGNDKVTITSPDGTAVFECEIIDENWLYVGDFYYYCPPVLGGETTGLLMTEVTRIKGEAWHGLQIEILAEGVPSRNTVNDAIKRWPVVIDKETALLVEKPQNTN